MELQCNVMEIAEVHKIMQHFVISREFIFIPMGEAGAAG